MTPHAKGLLITAIGGVALSFDVPLIKLGGGDAFSVLIVRCVGALVAGLSIWAIVRAVTGRPFTLLPLPDGIPVAIIYGFTVTFFVVAVQYTSAANVVFIVAFTPMLAALIGWLWLGETPTVATRITMAVMIAAVGIIVSDGLDAGNTFGDLCALMAAICIALAITLSRRSGKHMGFAPIVGGIVPIIIASIVLAWNQQPVMLDAPIFIIINGMVMLPVAYWCLATGPRYLSAPEVGMFYLLETVLAPIWVWIILAETPTPRVLVGGTILIGALAVHSLWQLRAKRLAVAR
ncbi:MULTISPECIES: DMT family transporter [unclassified Roseitalea]|uniref:DMT family transporter n=1 Tax=unclassified Roseitalea TaxID=2639107 RepID=UPI00273D1779|nr:MULTISPECIES: DMT family transporter [unclassified Roseitalea]